MTSPDQARPDHLSTAQAAHLARLDARVFATRMQQLRQSTGIDCRTPPEHWPPAKDPKRRQRIPLWDRRALRLVLADPDGTGELPRGAQRLRSLRDLRDDPDLQPWRTGDAHDAPPPRPEPAPPAPPPTPARRLQPGDRVTYHASGGPARYAPDGAHGTVRTTGAPDALALTAVDLDNGTYKHIPARYLTPMS